MEGQIMSMLRLGQDGRIGHRFSFVGWGFLAALLIIIAAPSVAPAQRPNRPIRFYPDDSDTADALLRNAASHARDGQWAEAVEIYQRVIEQYGEKVVKLGKDDPAADPSGESVLFVDLRRFCQRRLAALPPEARKLYRSRVDSQAERWFQEGTRQRDRSLLRRVVEETFCSSRGDDALDLLGDLAFQDGRFGEALLMYRQLVPDQPDDRSGLVHPDPSVDLARVAAKKLLCRAALGENPPDPAALEAFATAYPNSDGTLAGRKGPYLESLKQALASDHLAPPAQPDSRWPTFAGSPTRTKVVPGSIDVGSLQWQIDLMPVPATRNFPPTRRMGSFPSSPIPAERLLAYHPIVLRDQVILCDETRVVAYNLNDRPTSASSTIKEVWRHDDDPDASTPQAARAFANVPRYTLTAFGDRIYARLGPAVVPYFGMGRMGMGMGMGGARAGAAQSAIVALDRSSEGKMLWKRAAAEINFPRRPEGSNRNAAFEGTPVADARSVYVAMTDRREQTTTYVVCLDAETGATRWVRYLGASSSDAENIMGFGMGMGFGPGYPSELGHRLLSLDGPMLYYQTNLGAVVALDAETGAIHWVATYPRIERAEGQARERDLNPAIIHEGLVIAAPDDSSSVYAFRAGTGRLVWKSDPLPNDVKLAHLLGVAKGRLIATGDRVVLFDVKTGKRVAIWPDGPKGYEGFGRGILAGDRIYWPTRTEIHILDQVTGLRTDPPIKLQESFQTSGGNLAVGDGYLIIAQTDKLVVFCQNSRLIQRYRDEIALAPEQASNHFRLARAAEATGQDELALSSLASALRLARASETIDGFPLTDLARDHQYRLLIKLGKKAEQDKDWEQAERRFEAASTIARSDRDRLSARLALSEIQLDRGEPGRSVATLQRLLLDDRLRSLNVDAEDGHRMIRSDLLITDRLAAILRRHRRGLYAEFDREARALLERGRLEKDPRLLEEVGRSYPVAEVVPESLLALGQLNEAAQRPSEAAHAYKRLLACAPNDTRRAQALWGLAHAYEAQRLWVPARDTYLEALSRFPDIRLEDFGTETRVASLVNERLAQEPFDRMMSDRAEPIVSVPLVRRWSQPLEGAVHPLSAEGVPPSAEASRIFLVQGNTLRPVDPSTGAAPWKADLGATPVWVGYLADKIIAATETRLVALGLDKGAIQWQYDLGAADPSRRGAHPLARAEAGPVNPNVQGNGRVEGPPGLFQGFRIVGSRIFCLRGERDESQKFLGRELLAFDGDTGLVDWSYSFPSGTINPNLWIGPQRIVLQARGKPGAVLVLETSSGRRRAEYPQQKDEDWARPPLPIDDERVALVADRQTVTLFDLRRGIDLWVFHESRELPKNGPPLLLGNAERLLVLHDGTDLIRLDAATGKKRWSRPLGVDDLSERPEAMTFDGERFYWASKQWLSCLALSDGSLIWTRHLTGPESGWSIALTERCVMAFPTAKPGHVEGEAEGLPLVFRRRDTGELVQRLLFPVPIGEVAVRLTPPGALVAAQGGVWSLGERREANEPMTRKPD
jgi:outer membrane protein assembly factor BamB/tetratricopeptide (TPR) repeat protein